MQVPGLRTNKKKITRVKPGTMPAELMRIGHDNMSMTFRPDVKSAASDFAGDFVYMDCPGFLDNRGAEINIANAINIKATLAVVESARVIVLINYHSLKSDRGRGVKDLAKMLIDLFGNVERLRENAGALLVGISQAEPTDRDGDAVTREDVCAELTDTTGLSAEHAELIEVLSEHVFVFDLFNEGDPSWLQRDQLVAALQDLTPIFNASEIFRTVLTSEDEQEVTSCHPPMHEPLARPRHQQT